jgi:hypothetical protein
MSVEVGNVYRRNNDNKLSVVTKRTARDLDCGLQRRQVIIVCAAAAVGGEVDDTLIVLITS